MKHHYLSLILGLIALSASAAPSGLSWHPDRGSGPSTIQTKSSSSSPSTSGPSSAPSRKSEEPIKDDSAVKLTTEVVTFTVTVTDDHESLVPGLERQDFEVFEDKIKQEIEYFNYEDAPVSAGIIFDVSGSMEIQIDRAREVLRSFIQTSHDDDDFFLIGFNQRPNLLAEFAAGEALLNKLSLVRPRGSTALYDAVYLGVEKVQQGSHRKKVLLIISDGEDNASRYTYRELRNRLKESDVQIYCIGTVDTRKEADYKPGLSGRDVLAELAGLTGGKAFFPGSDTELDEAVTEIALELRHQYSIGYLPGGNRHDGKWHQIKVRVHRPRGLPKLNVCAKEGYYALPR